MPQEAQVVKKPQTKENPSNNRRRDVVAISEKNAHLHFLFAKIKYVMNVREAPMKAVIRLKAPVVLRVVVEQTVAQRAKVIQIVTI